MAERLTDCGAPLESCVSTCANCDDCDARKCEKLHNIVHRLSTLENILYNPDGTPRVTMERLAELVGAEVEGRIAVLPCKVGDTVYYIIDGKVESAVLRAIRVQISPNELTEYVFEGCIQHCKYVYCWVIGQLLFVTEPEAQAALERQGAQPPTDEVK